MSPRNWIATVAVLTAISGSSSVRADSRNEVRAVTFDEDSGVTRVHVRGAQTPTFTVYKLERPSRVVIDLPQARLAEALKGHESAATFSPSTWAVSTIAAQQLDDGAVRVIVSLARPGRYDVKTDGNEVIIYVMPRDPAPRMASVEDLDRANAEADRLRKVAETAQRALDDAKKNQGVANAAALAKAKQDVDAARVAAAKAQSDADRIKNESEQAKREAAKARDEAAAAKGEVAAARDEAARSRADAEARLSKQRADAEAQLAKQRAATDAMAKQRADAEAQLTKQRVDADAQLAKQRAATDAMAKQRADAEAQLAKQRAQTDAVAKQRADAEAQLAQQRAATDAVAKQRADADAQLAKQRAETDAMAKQRADIEAQLASQRAETDAKIAKQIADADAKIARQRAEANTLIEKSRAEAEAAKQQIAKAYAEADSAKEEIAKARAEADAAKTEAARAAAAEKKSRAVADAAKAEAARAHSEADKARADAETARLVAAADKKQAEAERIQAEKIVKDSKSELAAIEKRATAAQELEDKARAANAAAQAREEAARDVETRAMKDREMAETAAKQAQTARDRAAQSDRAKLVADAKAAEDRLAKAKHATEEAEAQRVAAEQAAAAAKKQLEQSKTALAGVEQQRSAVETAATEAARKRSEAEAAATDATRRRSEAELAAADASKKRADAERAAGEASKRRGEAEQQRVAAETQKAAAEQAARTAEAAAKAADKQRMIAEASAKQANAAKQSAEASLAELETRRVAAERAATELETRSKAEAKAKTEVAAAQARDAGAAEIAKARAEVTRLGEERKRAEAELADRRKAVAMQQAESAKLETAAAQAKDAADREESRRAKLAQQRESEEKQLAAVRAEKAIRGDRGAHEAHGAKASSPGAPSSVGSAKKAFVKDVAFTGTEGSGTISLAIDGDADIHLGEVTPQHVELIVDHAELGPKLERTLDVSRFGSPIKQVSSFRDRRSPDRVRLIAELVQPATPTLERDAAGAHLAFSTDKHVARTTSVPSPIVGGFGAASTPIAQQSVSQVPPAPGGKQRIYHGATVDFDFKDAPIHDLLRIIADTGHVNVVVPDTINANVTVRLKRVPWDQALEVILASHGLWYRREGNLYRIATRKEIDAENEAEAARREAAVKAETPKTDTVTLSYSSAAELKPKLEQMKSPKGSIEVDERTNTLIINDVAANRDAMHRLALALDTQTPQITIEARIVEARSDFVRQFGIQWGGNALTGANGGNATGLVWPSSIGVVGGNEDQNTKSTGVALPSNFAVNIPAATGTGEGGALGISLGSVGGNFNLNFRLSALEDVGTVRIISAPKITVLDNREAFIKQGVSIPISVVSAAGTQTQFVQADLQLKVTPHVSQRDCLVAMTLDVTKNEPDFVNVGARGDPTILRKEAHTVMLVNDGETTVLGGIYTRNSGLAYKKVPFFGDLPFIGWLFKNRRENDDRTEVLVFITPRITNRASLRCVQ